MNDQANSQNPIEREVASYRQSALPFFLIGICVFFAGLGSGYLLFSNNNQPSSQNAKKEIIALPTVAISPTSPAPTDPTLFSWPIISASESATWKTYTDDNLGFSLKYPSDWRVIQSYDSVILTFDPEDFMGRFRGLHISVLKNPTNDSPTAIYKKDLTGIEADGFIVQNQPPYFSRLDAVVVAEMGGAGHPGPIAYINNNNGNTIELFSESMPDSDNPYNSALASKIFSTFHFIK